MILYASDLGVLLSFPMLTGDVDGASIDSARLMALPPSGGRAVELAVSIDDATTEAITIVHTTSGSLARAGCWTLRAFFFVGGTLVLSSLEFALEVTARKVAPPT